MKQIEHASICEGQCQPLSQLHVLIQCQCHVSSNIMIKVKRNLAGKPPPGEKHQQIIFKVINLGLNNNNPSPPSLRKQRQNKYHLFWEKFQFHYTK